MLRKNSIIEAIRLEVTRLEEKIAFSILGIEETKEEDKIKAAYRTLLVKVNPEEDMEGFKRLRQAYETALAYTQKKEERLKLPETEVEFWLEEVKEVYFSLHKRLDLENWDFLLNHEVCLALDTTVEAREKLLIFLMDHYRLKVAVWKKIDQVFDLVAAKEELYETFPKNFIEFVCYQCQAEEDGFPMEWFQGEDRADYDTFFQHYYELCGKLDEESEVGLQAAEQIIATMDGMEILHPFYSMEKARFFYQKGQKEESLIWMKKVYQDYSSNLRIKTMYADYLWMAKEQEEGQEEAASIFKEIIEVYETHYLANLRLGQYYYKKQEYAKAKESCLTALNKEQGEGASSELLKSINEAMIQNYQKELEDGEVSLKKQIEIGWCYLQNEKPSIGLEILEKLVLEEELATEFYCICARLSYADSQYEKAIKYANQWRTYIEKEMPESEEERERQKIRIAHTYEIVGQSFRNLSKSEPDSLEKGMEAMLQAIAYAPFELKFHAQLASFYLDLEQPEKALEVCETMQGLYADYFWTLVYRQKAYFQLKKSQEVIDYFYKAKAIYAYYSPMYELAAKVFSFYEQWDDLFDIVEQAEQNEMMTTNLKLLKILVLRQKAENKEDFTKVLDLAKELKRQFTEEAVGEEEFGQLEYEMARCYRELEDQKAALVHINQALQHENKPRYLWIKANIFLSTKKYKEALELYQICEEEYEDNPLLIENKAICYKYMNEGELALTAYKKVLELEPQHHHANGEILKIYQKELDEKQQIEIYEKGLPYADAQLELVKNSYYYIERGLFHMEARKWEPAIADFLAAIELDPENTYAYNNLGCVYMYMERYEEAVKTLEKSAEVMVSGQTFLPLNNLGDCYERMACYEKAKECYEKNIELFPNKKNIKEYLYRLLYGKLSNYSAALPLLEQLYEKGSERYYKELLLFYCKKGDLKKAFNLVNIRMNAPETSFVTYLQYGKLLMGFKRKYRTTIFCMKKAIALAEPDSDDLKSGYQEMAAALYFSGKKKKAEEYAKQAFVLFEQRMGNWETYIKRINYQLTSLYEVGFLFFFMGEYEKAEALWKQMTWDKKCSHCVNAFCVEQTLLKGLLLEEKGDLIQALSCFEQAQQEDFTFFGFAGIHRLKKKQKGRKFFGKR